MVKPFHYSTRYKLDKSHFSETFDESISTTGSISEYKKAIVLLLLGFAILYFSNLNRYGAWFIVILGCVDACSVYFKKPWWLARQMISEAANVELTLTIDDKGVNSKSFAVDTTLLWDDLSSIEQTKQGWLLYHKGGRNYLSRRCLSEDANDFIASQAKQLCVKND